MNETVSRPKGGPALEVSSVWVAVFALTLALQGCGGGRPTPNTSAGCPRYALAAREPTLVAGTSEGICEFSSSGRIALLITSGCRTVPPLSVMVHEYEGDTRLAAKPLDPAPQISLPKDGEQPVELALPRLRDETTRIKLELQAACDGVPGYADGTYLCKRP